MAQPVGISLEELRVLARRAGMCLSTQELEHLRSLYDAAIEMTTSLHGIELDAEDLAVAFSPDYGETP